MRDLHRERLTHLLANAILELWKKETGSLSSVVIEGTICITSSTGKTTVLQVADRFTGSIPEAEEDVGHSFSPPDSAACRPSISVMRSFSMPPGYGDAAPPRVDCQNQAAMAAFLDNLSPASLVSPGTEYSRSSLERRSPGSFPANHREQALDVSSGSVKEEMSESGSDTVAEEKTAVGTAGPDNATGGICPGTGYYTCAPRELNNNTIDPKYALKFYKGRSPRCSPDRNKRRRSPPPGHSADRKRSSLDSQKSTSPIAEVRDRPMLMPVPPMSAAADNGDAMDLTRKEVDDLALSPPHSYTAQVRDIIRQRVLSGHVKVSGPQGENTQDEAPPAEAEQQQQQQPPQQQQHPQQQQQQQQQPPQQQEGKVTPKMLESLGLHRSVETVSVAVDITERSRWQDLPREEPRSKEQLRDSRIDGRNELRVSNSRHSSGGSGGTPSHSSSLPGPPVSTNIVSPSSSPASSSSSSTSSVSATTNGPLHNILQHRLYLPLPSLQQRPSMGPSGPSSAPAIFTHPGFSPLSSVLQPASSTSSSSSTVRDASPSPTDLSLDSSGEGDKDVGPNGEQRVYRCEFCTKTFLFKSKYHEHLPVHTNARPFQCHLCSRTYKYKYDLRVHLRTHMGIPTKSTVCPFCNTKFDTNKRLRVHIKEAHRDKQKVTEDDCTQTQDNLPPAL